MFKTACFGARASSTRFLTNSYRMILAAFCLLILKIMTFLQRKSVANAHAKMRPVHEMSIGKLRVRVICVTSKIKATKGEIQLTLPSVMHECKIQPFPRRIPKFPWQPAQQRPKWHQFSEFVAQLLLHRLFLCPKKVRNLAKWKAQTCPPADRALTFMSGL